MAQNANTVTAPNPTPPTNFGFTGVTGPNPPNYTRQSYANPFNLDAAGKPQSPYGVNPNPPPYYDDGTGGVVQTFATNVAALASGTSAADNTATPPAVGTNAAGAGGTGVSQTVGTYPGVTSGLVPASSSVAHEGSGTEVTVLAPGNINYSYVGGATLDTGRSASCGPVLTPGTMPQPNQLHASSLSPAVNPTLTSVSAGGASGGGTATCTATGTGFTKQSVLNINGINYPTTFVSSTSLTAVAPKKATAGSVPVVVITGGAVQTAPQNWTFT